MLDKVKKCQLRTIHLIFSGGGSSWQQYFIEASLAATFEIPMKILCLRPNRTYGTKVVYLPFYHILLTFRISINFPEKSTKQKPFVPCFFLVGDFQQRFPGVQLRNRLAKLEQALRNKDEPGDHRFASKIIETVGMFLDFLCF